MDRQQLRTTGAFTTVELLRIHAQDVNAKADSALGEARLGIEDEVLRPLLSLALGVGRVGVVTVEVGVAQVQRGLAIIDKTFGAGCHRHGQHSQAAATDQAQGIAANEGMARGADREIAGEFAHSDAPLFFVVFIFCYTSSYNIGANICEVFEACQSKVIR
ncbi:hypothetical protein D3C73_725090 [compost metagenome]